MKRLVLVLASVFFSIGLASQVYAQSGPYSQIVDNSQKARFYAPGAWKVGHREASYGQGYRFIHPSETGKPARFKVRIPRTGSYAVYLRWPASTHYNAGTPVGVRTTSGYKWTHVNQRKNGNKWVKLGTYEMGAGDRYSIKVSRHSSDPGRVVADAVRVVETSAERTIAANPDSMSGAPIRSQATVESYARSKGATKYIMKTIPIYYRLAPKRDIRPDVLVAQAMVETGMGHYGGDSKPWNMAGIKKGGNVGDAPEDFERPATAYEGVRMHVNHMCAYMGKQPIGKPHDRYYDARAAQKSKGWWVTRISQLGNGVWATDPHYSGKIRNILDEMGNY